MSKRLVLDLTKCESCDSCTVECGYFYAQNADGRRNGIESLKEKATFSIICRRCELASCIKSCPYDALRRQPDGTLRRLNLRCVSCKLCTQGCPFGTIYPDIVGFYVTPCDQCLRTATSAPDCIAGCSSSAISFRELEENEPGIHVVDERLAVIAPKWEKENV